MTKTIDDYSPSLKVAIKTLFAMMNILKENGGNLKIKDIIKKISEREKFNEWESEKL